MSIRYTKMDACGNSFMLIEWPNNIPLPSPEIIRKWSSPSSGIGFDQLMIIKDPSSSKVDAKYITFNSDGSEAEQCGNGARCVARYLTHKYNTKNIKLESLSGHVDASVINNNKITTSLGIPEFSPKSLPFFYNDKKNIHQLNINGSALDYSVLSMGNPHAVIINDNLDEQDLKNISDYMQKEKNLFPESVNVGFMKIKNKKELVLRVFERGAGETLACGTGAAAAAAIGIKIYNLDLEVRVIMPGGILEVHWPGLKGQLWLTGEVNFCYEGDLNYERSGL